jgi:hypothetical protein
MGEAPGSTRSNACNHDYSLTMHWNAIQNSSALLLRERFLPNVWRRPDGLTIPCLRILGLTRGLLC